ncbi:MAG: ATP-binding protein [bacterium]
MDTFRSFGPASEEFVARLKELREHIESSPKETDNVCPLCDGYGNIIDEQGARPCKCVLQLHRQNPIAGARIPRHYLKKDLNSFNGYTQNLQACLVTAREYVRDYSPEENRGLYIHGGPGSGKTHLAIGVLKGLWARGFDGVFYNLTDLFDQLRTSFSNESAKGLQEELLRDLERDILVLDDMALQKQTAWVSDRLYSFINYRYQNGKTLIITTNLSPRDFILKGGDVLASRVFAMCREIEVQGEDYRARMNRTGKTTWP